jgi:hypothetical protein
MEISRGQDDRHQLHLPRKRLYIGKYLKGLRQRQGLQRRDQRKRAKVRSTVERMEPVGALKNQGLPAGQVRPKRISANP